MKIFSVILVLFLLVRFCLLKIVGINFIVMFSNFDELIIKLKEFR